jgi:hypothetical protein
MPTERRVHFVERLGLMWQLAPNSSEWESGYWWRIGLANAEALKGGRIYFHKSQAEPSYCGGIIIGHRIEQGEKYRDRYVFKFRPSGDCKGVSAGPDNWFRGRKLVL